MNSYKMPVIFIGHGSPMNAIEDNVYTRSWKAIGKSLMAKPRAILMFSAHWITEGETRINTSTNLEMIYDMYGFPPELYHLRYDPLGSPELAEEIIEVLGEDYSTLSDDEHGIDHGAWSTLIHLFPEADIPVIQISLDYSKSPYWHYGLGKKIQKLREQGILIIGSGNIVHNLRTIEWNIGESTSPLWATEFDGRVKNDIEAKEYRDILEFQKWGEISRYAHPTYDHLLPLFPILGAIDSSDQESFFTPDIVMGSISMRSVIWK